MKAPTNVSHAPQGFDYLTRYLNTFRATFPHTERNVFIMMPFLGRTTDKIYKATCNELTEHGLIPLRADMREFSPILWWNVMTYMIGSSFGVVVYKPNKKVAFNPNVSIEAGFMIALDRPVLLLANARLKRLPVDFSGYIYKSFDPARLIHSVRSAVRDWVERDLSFCTYGDRKLIVFASLGGTCRCVMAKGILSKMLVEHKIGNVAVEAAAIADPHSPNVSPSAIAALREIECDTFLQGHRPRKMCRFLQERADLIVVLADTALSRTSKHKAKILTDQELFACHIRNPYPDKEDKASLERYRQAREKLASALSKNFQKLLDLVGATPTL